MNVDYPKMLFKRDPAGQTAVQMDIGRNHRLEHFETITVADEEAENRAIDDGFARSAAEAVGIYDAALNASDDKSAGKAVARAKSDWKK